MTDASLSALLQYACLTGIEKFEWYVITDVHVVSVKLTRPTAIGPSALDSPLCLAEAAGFCC